jgi:hypothetical protein
VKRNNYHERNGCWNCRHCLAIAEECWNFFCTMDTTPPPTNHIDYWDVFMPDDMVTRWMEWEKTNRVNSVGFCDKYQRKDKA